MSDIRKKSCSEPTLFPGSGEIDWEEVGWQTSLNGREALAIALTGMVQDGEITRARSRTGVYGAA